MSTVGSTEGFTPPALVIDAEGSTASKADLLSICSHSALYPKLPFTSSPAANHGNAFHRAVEVIIGTQTLGGEVMESLIIDQAAEEFGLDADSKADLYDEVGHWLDYYVETLKGSDVEASFAYNLYDDTVRKLGHNRDYATRKPGDLVMTVDQLQVLPGNGGKYVMVRDWKTGSQAHTSAARDNLQLAIAGAALAKHFGANMAWVAKVHVTPDGVSEDAYEISNFAIHHTIPEALKAIFLSKPSAPNHGPHCTGLFCPAVAVCPAAAAAVEDIPVEEPSPTKKHLPIVATTAAITSDEHCAGIINRLYLAEAMIEKAWAAVDGYVGNRSISLGDGWKYAPVEEQRKSIEVTEDALDVLERNLGKLAGTVQKRSVTQSAIKEATGKLATGKARTALERKIMAELKEAGAVKEKTIKFYKTMKEGKEDNHE